MTNARPLKEMGAVMFVPGGHVHGTADHPQDIPAQLRRRREASRRCEALHDGRRDPWSSPSRENDLDALGAWRRALEHLSGLGLPGLPPLEVRRALARRSAA